MQWTDLTRREQNEARKLARGELASIPDASVSQVAKYFDEATAYRDGQMTLADLLKVTGWRTA
jgi:hypothetical protein